MDKYHGKTVDEILDMKDGPKKKFLLLAVIVDVFGEEACEEAKKMSCDEIATKWLTT
jgi:hypothetical protein